MSSFKDKPLKKCHTDKRRMIDDLHNILIQDELTDKNEYYLLVIGYYVSVISYYFISYS